MFRSFFVFVFALFFLSPTVALAATPIQGILPQGTTTWMKAESPYLITNTLTIPVDATLTIEPGTIIKLGGNFFVYIYGTLNAGNGTGTEPVMFTSSKDDTSGGDTNGDGTTTTPTPGDWLSLYFLDGSQGTFNNTILRYGGYWNGFSSPLGHIFNQGGVVNIANSTFSNGGASNIRTSGGTTTITSSLFTSAPKSIFAAGGKVIIHNSRIEDNTEYGIFSLSDKTVDAQENWWGSATGPYHPTNATGTGNQVSDGVDFTPWLTSDPTEPAPTCTINCYSNVLFLPGMMGSQLYDDVGYQAWLPTFAGDALLRLPMNTYGTSTSAVLTGETIDEAYGAFNIYHSFIGQMNTLKTQGIIHDWAAVPYDWRLDYQTLLLNGRQLSSGRISYLVPPEVGHDPYILETLRQLASSSPTGKVSIIAHSNGGLLAKALTNKLGIEASQLIDKIIFVDVPQLGTPKAIAGLLHGARMGLPESLPLTFTETEARVLAQNMPLTYNLLPSNEYFHYVDDSVLNIDAVTIPEWVGKYGTTTHSTARLGNFLLDITRTKPDPSDLEIPEIGNPTLFARAQSVHDMLDHWTPPQGVQLITITGWGEETLSGIGYKKVKTCHGYFPIPGGCDFSSNDLTITLNHVIDGDGTVVEPSALWANGATSTRYWVNLLDYNDIVKKITLSIRAHADILEVPQLRTLITNILTGTSTQLDYISTVAPAYDGTTPRLHFTLHSPLTLGFTDTLGNYSGSTATTTFFNIPGVHYERYGDVQWLSMPKELAGHLVMRGTGSGSFTLDVEEVNGNTTLSTASFEEIPSGTSTIVTMNIVPTQSTTASSMLVVDQDGNGTPDFTLKAKENSSVTLDLTQPTTTATTTGTLGKNNWYTSNVLVTLTATDTESGVTSTTYSLNGGTTWTSYTAPFTITTEGTTTLLYRSTDKAGNMEGVNTLTLKIDKTAPEAQILVSTTTQDLLIEGTDNLGTTTATKDTSGNYTLTDQAGHTTKLFFTKTYSGKFLTYAKLTGIQYDTAPKITLPTSSFLYIWDQKAPATLLSQTIAVNDTYAIEALYDKKTNKTTVVILKKKLPYQALSFAGLKIVRLVTVKGVVGYGL